MSRLRIAVLVSFAAVSTLPAAAQSSIPPMDTSAIAGEKATASFLVQDSVGDVQLGRLGVQKAVDPAVRSLARAMVADHTRTAAMGEQIAQKLGVGDAAMKPESTNQIDLAHLSRYNGAAFDREYVKTLVAAHKSDLAELHDVLEFASDPAVRRVVTAAMAIDAKHLRMALAAQSRLE